VEKGLGWLEGIVGVLVDAKVSPLCGELSMDRSGSIRRVATRAVVLDDDRRPGDGP